MLVVVVFGVEQTLNHLNGQMDDDPVLGRAVAQVAGVDSALGEPLVHQVVGLRAGCNEFINLVGAQMLTVACMVRIGDYTSLAQMSRNLSMQQAYPHEDGDQAPQTSPA